MALRQSATASREGVFRNWSVRGKVIAAFAVVLLCTAGLGLFAIGRLSAVNTAAADIRENWLPSTRALGKVAQIAERVLLSGHRIPGRYRGGPPGAGRQDGQDVR